MNIISQTEYEEKKSKFIAIKVKLESQEDADAFMKKLQEEHPKARHILHVSRFPNKFGVTVTEASEDREPVSSMKKVRTFLERDHAENMGIYIVRYYGGTNLGASRLDHVYFTLAMKLVNEK